MKPTKFTVVAVSKNTNSFGLKSILLLAETGEAWQLLQSAYGTQPLPVAGDTFEFETDGTILKLPKFHPYECPALLPNCGPDAAKKLLKTIRKAIELNKK